MVLRLAGMTLSTLLAVMASSPPASAAQSLYKSAPSDHLPAGALLEGLDMDAGLADFDGDGDLDILIASEYRPNILLINDGAGRFTDGSDRIPQVKRDSEDVAIADFDQDGDLDAVIVTEDDKVNEYYRNTGTGRFEDAGKDLPVEGVTNGVIAGDVDGDGDVDLVLANNGQNVLVLNDGAGRFTDVTATHLPAVEDVTQDAALGDVDGDGDLDLLFGNEGPNRLLINDGAGRFADKAGALPERSQESREADFGDVDGDGDLDILEGNVSFFMQDTARTNRLLINNGRGKFEDGGDRLPADEDNSAEADLLDVDGDGDLDIVTTNVQGIRAAGMGRHRAYLNDGKGLFTDMTEAVFPAEAVGNGFDFVQGDLDGDGLLDLFISNRIGPDMLLLRRQP